jgi:PAS domain S-box-containing protein
LGRAEGDVSPEVVKGVREKVRAELVSQIGVRAKPSQGEGHEPGVRSAVLAQGESDQDELVKLAGELARERDLLNTIMDSTQAQIAYLDTQFNFLRVNAPYCQGSGHVREALIGRNHFALFPGDENRALFEQARDMGETVVVRAKPFRFPDQLERGTTYWDWTLTPVKDQEGEVQGLVLSLFDVTGRARSRQARKARLSRMRTLLDVSEQVLAETSVEGVLQRVVDAACELTRARIGTSGHGYREGVFQVGATSRAEDAPPCPPGEIFSVERGGVYMDLIQGAASVRLTDAQMRAHPAWWGLPEGHAPLRGLLGARLTDHQGQPNGLIMVSDKRGSDGAPGEFTEEDEALLVQLASLASLALWHIQARVESEQLRRRNALILDSAGEGIISVDAAGTIVSANPSAAAMVGWPAQELVGKLHHDTLHHTKNDGTPYSRSECLVTTTLADGAAFSVSDELYWRKDGTSFPVEYSSTPAVDEGEIKGAVLVFRDISERQEAQATIADLARFPSEDPNPVLRISREGVLLYANAGSAPILAAWGVNVGQPVPADWQEIAADAIRAGEFAVLEVAYGAQVFALAVVPLDQYVNLYALDITALRSTELALHRYAERLHVLHETDQAILAAQTSPEIAAAALNHMKQLIPYVRASVTLFDLNAGKTSLLAVHPRQAIEMGDGTRRPGLPRSEFLAELQEGQVQVFESLDESGYTAALAQMLHVHGGHASAHVPLTVQGELLGSLNLCMAASEDIGEEEIEVAREIASELAIGVRQADLLDQVQQHAERLEQQVRRRTAALQASQARFQAVFEEAAIGIALVSRRGRIVDANPALQRMLGYERDELKGMVFSKLAHPDNVRDDADMYEELVKGERSHYQVEGRYRRKDGRSIDADLIVSLVRPTKGRSSFAIALMEDVSERKRAQAALVESEKLALTGRLAASLAHEINNPLQSVVGLLSLAEEDLAEGRDAGRYIQIALEEVERAADLIARMRNLSRPSQKSEREPTDINALIERVLTLTKKKCQERHIEVEWAPRAGLLRPALESDRMQQVFMNLVLNAIDAMPGGGRLRVWTARCDAPLSLEVHIADTGVGIPSSRLPGLFEPFYTTKETGVGLGLYVSHNIVQEHGGRIEVESIEGEGTAFTVRLPVK